MKVLITLSYDDCSIRVYQSFTTIFYKCLILLLIFALLLLKYFQSPIMLKITLVPVPNSYIFCLNYPAILFIIGIASYIAS